MTAEPQRTCLVIMDFGAKTDSRTGRTLDLDLFYREVLLPAVMEAGLEGIRLDSPAISKSTPPEVYRQIFKADLVIADLLAGSEQTFYLLGLRHGLRPRPTIVIAEEQLARPFARAQVMVRPYRHHGEGEIEELSKFRAELAEAISAALAGDEVDSPVYARLPGLRPAGSPEGSVESGPIEPHMAEDLFGSDSEDVA